MAALCQIKLKLGFLYI